MHNRNPKLVAVLVIVSAPLLAVTGGLASAAGTRAGGKVHLYEADTALDGNLGTVILTGAITDHGKDMQGYAGGGNYNLLKLSKGSFEVNIGVYGNALNFPVDQTTCSSDGSATAAVPIVPGTGTGAYKGIGGTIDITASLASIVPRQASGKCATNATRYPGVLLAIGSGTVSYQ
jgi:hypothetical protein